MAEQTAAIKQSRLVAASPVYFGWFVVLAGSIGMAMTLPGQTAGISLFIDSFIADLGLSRTAVSVAYTLATLTGALLLPFVGRAIDRFGPRASVIAIALIFAATTFFMGRVVGIVTLFVGFALTRAVAPGALSLVSQNAVNLWFIRRRGAAVGVLGVGLAAGTAVFPTLIEHLLAQYDWRTVFDMVGAALLLILLPVGALLYRGQPERYGLAPDGRVASDGDDGFVERILTLPAARRTKLFWILTAGGVCVGGLGTGVLFHHFSILGASGIDRSVAALFFIPLGVMTALGNVTTGFLVDRFSPLRLMAAQLMLFAAVLLFLPFVNSPALVWTYGLVFGAVQGMQGAVLGSAYGHYFGRAHLGSIMGFAKTIFVGGTAIGPVIYAAGLDALGSYHGVIWISTLLPAAVAMAALRTSEPKPDASDA